MCATECSVWCHAWCDGRAMWVACNRARFPATWPRVFCELKLMKIVILIHQIIQKKFAYGEFFNLVMTGYIFMFRMVKKKSRCRNSIWVNPKRAGGGGIRPPSTFFVISQPVVIFSRWNFMTFFSSSLALN